MKTLLVISIVTSVITCVRCSVALENGTVTDPLFKSLGYACLSSFKAIGAMKQGEVKNIRGGCAIVECHGGIIKYVSCVPPVRVDHIMNCKIISGDRSKRYPECCATTLC